MSSPTTRRRGASEPDLDAVRERLRAAGLRATPARIAVFRALSGRGSPLSHAEVCEAVEAGGYDRATIYRNLVDLAEAGLLRRSDLGDHVWRFESVEGPAGAEDEAGHPHFVCNTCGEVTCLPEDSVQVAVPAQVPRSLRAGSRGAARLEIHIRGTCDDCV